MRNAKILKRRDIPDAGTLEKDPAYRKILDLDFNEMIPFVLSNIRKRGFFPLLYLSYNTASLFFLVLYVIISLNSGMSAGKIFGQIMAGILVGSVLVIPPHEILHGIAYLILGARNIKFGVDLHQFIFYVTADRFPISRRELALLALTPFIVINIALIAVTVLWARQITLFSASLLLSHNIMCIGDFAIIGFAYGRRKGLITYDDPQKKRSYFYEKNSEPL